MIKSSTLRLFPFFISLFFIAANSTFAQTNGDMEDWSPSGSPPPFNWMFPTGWTTTNATSEFIGAGVSRSPDAHSGMYSAQIRTLDIFGTITRSQLALGNVKLDPPMYRLIGYTGGEPLQMIPDHLTFHYLLTTGNVNEYAVADILIKRREAGDPYPDTVFFQSVHLPPVFGYQEVNVPFPSQGINPATDSIVIVFSSNDTSEIALNTLHVDDISIDFVSSVVPGPDSNQSYVYPNPVGRYDQMFVAGDAIKKISIMDLAGRIVFATTSNLSNPILLDPCLLTPGTYIVRINDDSVQKLVVIE